MLPVNIDSCIKQIKYMSNISDGGSPCYIFWDYVLVVYSMDAKYGVVRKNEESIMDEVNIKANMGVNTPRHVAIRRETVDGINYCYVLQEKAKGECFAKYCDVSMPLNKIDKQREVANIPQEHFDKYASDLIELFYFGLETKPKNFFYDKDVGFTTIDLLKDGKEGTFDKESLADIRHLFDLLYSLRMAAIPSYYESVPEDIRNVSKEMDYTIMFKIFNAVKNNIPNFDKFERFILRCYDQETLEVFKGFGVDGGDLKLTPLEEEYFVSMINKIARDEITKVKSGKYNFWQIEVNEIRNDVEAYGLKYSWMYHKGNKRSPSVPPEDWYPDEEYKRYDYESLCAKDIESLCYRRFIYLLEEEYNKGDNEFINAAYKDYLDRKNKFKM